MIRYIQCIHTKLYHLTVADYEEFTNTILSARAAFQITPEGHNQFKDWIQSIRRFVDDAVDSSLNQNLTFLCIFFSSFHHFKIEVMQERIVDANQRRDAKPNKMTTARFDQLRSSIIITPERNNSLFAGSIGRQSNLSHLHTERRTRYANRC